MSKPTILLRAESKPFEHRSVLTPSTVSALVDAGFQVNCERCNERCFRDEEMEAAGATLVPTGSWPDAPLDHIIVGLKELNPLDTFPLKHAHLHFAHVYKNQPNWVDLLLRFAEGGGSMLDIEFIKDPQTKGRLLAPSSFHAGFCGAVLAVQAWANQVLHPDDPELKEATCYDSEREAIVDTAYYLQNAAEVAGRLPTVMVVGPTGKCGLGAIDLCRRLDLPEENIIRSGRIQTSSPDFPNEVLQADILINCIYLAEGVQPFVTVDSLKEPGRRLSVVSDVSCDGDDANNPIAIYAGHTSFERPCMMVPTRGGPPLSVISIDHLPSLIPRDASEYCAKQLLPSFLALKNWRSAPIWKLALGLFQEKMTEAVEMGHQRPQGLASLPGHSDSSLDVSTRSDSVSSSDELADSSSATSAESDNELKTPPVKPSIPAEPSLLSTPLPTPLETPLETRIEEELETPMETPFIDPAVLPKPGDAFDTKVVHAGHLKHDAATGAVSMPIAMSSTYAQTSADHVAGNYVYSRKSNPNRSDFERSVAALEHAKYGLAFSSGSAAIAMIINMLEPYSNIIAIADVYAGTQRTFTLMAESLRISTTYVEARELETNLSAHTSPRTKMIWIESPSNPLLQVIDIEAIAKQAHRRGILVVVDNTLASPYVFNPLVHGADIVVHSATKHLSGHNDLVIGVLAVNSRKLRSRLSFLQNAIGAVPSPFDCWLASRGLRTIHLRVARATANAQVVAEALEKSRFVLQVIYPGLASYPQREIVKKQHNHGGAGGALISFRIQGGFKAAEAFCRSLRLFTLAESFGSVQSLCEVPGPMTHKLLTSEQRAAIGVHDDLVRLSMGIEQAEDLVADVLQGLEAVCA